MTNKGYRFTRNDLGRVVVKEGDFPRDLITIGDPAIEYQRDNSFGGGPDIERTTYALYDDGDFVDRCEPRGYSGGDLVRAHCETIVRIIPPEDHRRLFNDPSRLSWIWRKLP